MKKIFSALLILFTLGSAFSNEKIFKLNPVTDSILLGSGVALNATWLIMEKGLNIKNTTEVFDGNIFDKSQVNSLDQIFMNPYSKTIDKLADIPMWLGILSPAVLTATPLKEWTTVVTMYAETFLLANATMEFTKYAVSRPRPYMYFDGFNYEDIENGDWSKSFPSGHSTRSFAGATFASYVFCKYFPESPWRFAVIGGSYAIAATTAGLRLASGNHFFTDVLTGAAIGSAIGFLIPWLHTLNIKKENSDGTSAQLYFSPLGVDVVFKL